MVGPIGTWLFRNIGYVHTSDPLLLFGNSSVARVGDPNRIVRCPVNVYVLQGRSTVVAVDYKRVPGIVGQWFRRWKHRHLDIGRNRRTAASLEHDDFPRTIRRLMFNWSFILAGIASSGREETHCEHEGAQISHSINSKSRVPHPCAFCAQAPRTCSAWGF